MEDLPFVDEHSIQVSASRESAWRALTSVLGGQLRGQVPAFAVRALGAQPHARVGDWRHDALTGDALPGFRVVDSQRPSRLALRGEHRFSRYALVFELDELGHDSCVIRAQTWAAFPGSTGRVYRALVIGSQMHVLAVRQLLARAASRA